MNGQSAAAAWIDAQVNRNCGTKIQALERCNARYRSEPERSLVCSHLNKLAAMCLVEVVCPEEVAAVKIYCTGPGTERTKNSCRIARENLNTCLEFRQDNPEIE